MDYRIKKYKHDAPYSYTPGMALTIELIKRRRDSVHKIYVHPDYLPRDKDKNIYELCESAKLPNESNSKIFERLALKGNTFVLGVFEKYENPVQASQPHIVLVNPSDSGNLGTIVRTGVGFGFHDFVIIRPGVDIFEPKVIRASMGALFHSRFSYFQSFEEYMQKFPEHKLYSFMLDGKTSLKDIKERPAQLFSLVFGNEAAGLPDVFASYGESVVIKHNNEIDSLNLSIAFGIAANAFSE